MKNVIFLTFTGSTVGDEGKYRGIADAGNRLVHQAKKSKQFEKTFVVDWPLVENYALENFIMLPSVRNKYSFTPLLSAMALDGLFGVADYYFYAGAGCEISGSYFSQFDFHKMISKCRKSGIYVEGTRYKDISWCKKELIDFVGSHNNDLDSGQAQATFFILKGGHKETRKLISKWVEVSVKNNGSLIDDTYIKEVQSPLFIAPRNDQSIFSLLLKIYGFRIYLEKRRGFGKPLRNIRSSRIFIFTTRNRTGISQLPNKSHKFYIGLAGFMLAPVFYMHDLLSDVFLTRKQYDNFPKSTISRRSTWKA
jgi:hypothetical protein